MYLHAHKEIMESNWGSLRLASLFLAKCFFISLTKKQLGTSLNNFLNIVTEFRLYLGLKKKHVMWETLTWKVLETIQEEQKIWS